MRAPGLTALALGLWAYCVWLVATNAVANPSYTAAAPFHAAFLAGGFAIGRRLDGELRSQLAAWLSAGAVLLALWGLGQVAFGEASRAHALFETPATFAAALNLALAPLLVMLALGGERRLLAPVAILLAAGLAAAESRGGLLALPCGLLAGLFLARRAGFAIERQAVIALALVIVSGWAIAALAQAAPAWLGAGAGVGQAHRLFGAQAGDSGASRFELYTLALLALQGHWGLGIGYLGFNALFEAGKLALFSYGADATTWFVHNDYLQTLLELGLPGLAALLAMVLAPFAVHARGAPRERDEALRAAALLAALATMAVHALADFPFYIPLCLLLFGLIAGVLDRLHAPEGALGRRWQTPGARLAAIVITALFAVVLAPPVAAEAAAWNANRNWRAAKAESAAYWFEVARRIEPRDWRYHWYAGQFWLAQAAVAGKPAAARLAEEAFAAGAAANPRDVHNLLGRIATHRHFGALLEQPADDSTLRAWAELAGELAPHRAEVRALRALRGAN